MNKKGGVGIIIFLVFALLLVLAWLYSKGFDFGLDKAPANVTIENKTQCVLADFPEIEKMAVYFDDNTVKGLNIFLDNSNSKLYCAFEKLEDKAFAERLVAMKNTGRDIKVYFGIDETMKDCETLCVPKLESQYTFLLGEGIPVSYGRISSGFCVNERAVFLFSYFPQTTVLQNNGLIIFSPELKEKYEVYFNEIFD